MTKPRQETGGSGLGSRTSKFFAERITEPRCCTGVPWTSSSQLTYPGTVSNAIWNVRYVCVIGLKVPVANGLKQEKLNLLALCKINLKDEE